MQVNLVLKTTSETEVWVTTFEMNEDFLYNHQLTVVNCYVQFFVGNIQSKLHRSTLRPPVGAKGIRIVPEIRSKDIRVCLRFELLGCPFQNGKFIVLLCGSRKCPYSPHGRDWKFLGVGGV